MKEIIAATIILAMFGLGLVMLLDEASRQADSIEQKVSRHLEARP
jgi:type II secretory pathway component PulJ